MINFKKNKEINFALTYKTNSIYNTISKEIKSDWKFILGILLFVFLLHLILWKGWPLHSGADANTYIYYFVDSFSSTPIYHNLMCFRTPLAPFFFGPLLTLGGSILTSIILEILALSAILLVYLTAIPWGKWTSRIITILFTLMIAYYIQYHQVGADCIFAWLALLFCFILRFAIQKNTIKLWITLGVIIALITLTRPAGLAFIFIIIFIPFLKIGWKKTLSSILAVLLSAGIILCGYTLYKNIRYEDFSISRGTNRVVLYRVFRLQDNAIKPENGPYTKKLINIIENDLLTTKVYRDYEVTLDDFLTYKPNSRFNGDLIAIVDLKEGWDNNYKLLAQVTLESIKADPKTFVKIYVKDIADLLTQHPSIPNIPRLSKEQTEVKLNEKGLPVPSEGEMIPGSYRWWLSTRPDESTTPTEEEITKFHEKSNLLISCFTSSEGDEKIKSIIDFFWKSFYIPVIYLWVLGLLGIIINKGKDRIYLLSIYVIAIIYLCGTLLGTPPWLKYRLPLDSTILIFGVVSLSTFLKRILKYNYKENGYL